MPNDTQVLNKFGADVNKISLTEKQLSDWDLKTKNELLEQGAYLDLIKTEFYVIKHHLDAQDAKGEKLGYMFNKVKLIKERISLLVDSLDSKAALHANNHTIRSELESLVYEMINKYKLDSNTFAALANDDRVYLIRFLDSDAIKKIIGDNAMPQVRNSLRSASEEWLKAVEDMKTFSVSNIRDLSYTFRQMKETGLISNDKWKVFTEMIKSKLSSTPDDKNKSDLMKELGIAA
jgi:hypothetical protein